jgi:hypothetical protein
MGIDWEKLNRVLPYVDRVLAARVNRDILEFDRGNELLVVEERSIAKRILREELKAFNLNSQELRFIESYINAFNRGVAKGASSIHSILRTHLLEIKKVMLDSRD